MLFAKGSRNIVVIIGSFLLFSIIVSVLIGVFLNFYWIYLILGIILFCGFFIFWTFRDPKREVIVNSNGIIAPADGKLMDFEKTKDGFSCTIRMSAFNVHINRSPIDGIIKSITFQKGSFWPVYFPNYAKRNQRLITIIENKKLGITAEFTQVSGIYGRRTILYPEKGEEVKQSKKIGIIRFGSLICLKITGLKNFKIVDPLPISVRAGKNILATFGEESG